jgi:hypothetical protein
LSIADLKKKNYRRRSSNRKSSIVNRQLLDSAGAGLRAGRRRRSHQAQTLEEKDRPLRRAPPHQLAALALAVLHVNIAAPILQAAILKDAVDENPVIQNDVLVLKSLALESVHGIADCPLPIVDLSKTKFEDRNSKLETDAARQPNFNFRLSSLSFRSIENRQ